MSTYSSRFHEDMASIFGVDAKPAAEDSVAAGVAMAQPITPGMLESAAGEAEAAHRQATLASTRGEPTLTSDEADWRRFLARKQMVDVVMGRAPAANEETAIDAFTRRKLMDNAAVLATEGEPQEREWATQYLEATNDAINEELNSIDTQRAMLSQTPDDVSAKVSEMQAAGLHPREIARSMAMNKWRDDVVLPAYMDFLQTHIDTAIQEGDIESANRLGLARNQLIRYGSNIDPNGPEVNWSDVYYDDMLKAQASELGTGGKLYYTGVNGMVESARMIRRFAGFQGPEDRDMMERFAQAITEEAPTVGFAGTIMGSFLDPGWYLVGGAVAKLGSKALAMRGAGSATRARYAERLVAAGTPESVAKAAAAALTPERAAMQRLGEVARSFGAKRLGMNLSDTQAATVGQLLYRGIEGAIGEGAIEAGIAISQDRPLPEVLARTFTGAAMGVAFGSVLDRGLAFGSRAMKGTKKALGVDIPKNLRGIIEEQVELMRVSRHPDADLDAWRDQWVEGMRQVADAQRLAGRTLNDAEMVRVLRGAGVDLDMAGRARAVVEANIELEGLVRRAGGPEALQRIEAMDEGALASEIGTLRARVQDAGEAPAEADAAQLELAERRFREEFGREPDMGPALTAPEGEIVDADDVTRTLGDDLAEPAVPDTVEAAQTRVNELERELFGPELEPGRRAELVKEWEKASSELVEATTSPGRAAPQRQKLIRHLRRRIGDLEQRIEGPKLDPERRIAVAREIDRIRAVYDDVTLRGERGVDMTDTVDRPAPGDGAQPARPIDLSTEAGREEAVLRSDRPIRTREDVIRGLQRSFKLDDEKAGAVAAILDARAEAWSRQTGRPAEDWFATRIADVRGGGRPRPGQLFQTNPPAVREGFQYRSDYRPDPVHELPPMRRAMRARQYTPGAVVHTTGLDKLAGIRAQGLQPSPDADGDFAVWASTVSDEGAVVGGALSYGRGAVPVVLELDPSVAPAGQRGDVTIASEGKSYVKPEHIKRVFVGDDPTPYTLDAAISRSKAIDRGALPQVLFQEQPPRNLLARGMEGLGFTRKGESLIREKMGGKATPDQLEGMLRKNGVSADEMRWTGLDDLILEAREDGRKLTKDEVLEHIQEHAIVLQEITKGEQAIRLDPDYVEAEQAFNVEDMKLERMLGELEAPDGVDPHQWRFAKAVLSEYASDPINAGFGWNFFSVSAASRATGPNVWSRWRVRQDGKPAEDGIYTTAVEATLRAEEIEASGSRATVENIPDEEGMPLYEYLANDVDESLRRQVFETSRLAGEMKKARRRAQERHRAQYSDWTLPGGDNYREILLTIPSGFDPARAESARISRRQVYRGSSAEPAYKGDHFSRDNIVAHIRTKDRVIDGKRVLFVEEIRSDWMQARRRAIKRSGFDPDPTTPHPDDIAPAGPWEKKWHEMALRRVVRMAAEGDYDEVAWTSGDVQNERYFGLVEEREYRLERVSDDRWERVEHDPLGRVLSRTPFTPDEFRAAHGVQKYQEVLDQFQQGAHAVSYIVKSDDLGTFYDKILPSYAAKFAKKYGAGEPVFKSNLGDGGTTIDPDLEEASGWFLDIAPMREAVRIEGVPLWQRSQNRIAASVEFVEDGRAIIRALEKPDITSALHEIGHIFRRDLTPDQLAVVNKWAGVRDGVWTREAEEKFARAWERYLRDGSAPRPELRGVFAKLAAWFTTVYQSIRRGPLHRAVDPELKRVFDELLGGQQMPDPDIPTVAQPGKTKPRSRPRQKPRKKQPARRPQEPAEPAGEPTPETTAGEPEAPEAGKSGTGPADPAPTEPTPAQGDAEGPPPPRREPAIGREGELVLPAGRVMPARYGIVEADDLVPSHDPLNQYQPNEFGDANERDYADPTEGATYRENVRNIADNPRPELLLTDTPSAVDGPPIITEDRVVLGGNARTMAQQVLYNRGGDSADDFRRAVRAAASRYGIEGADQFENPVLVRMVSNEDAGPRGELSRELNQALTTGRTADTDAVSRGQRLSDEDAAGIARNIGDGTIRDALNDPGRSARIMGTMRGAGALSDADLSGLVDQRGIPNQSGKDVIERTLLGAAVGDVRRMAEASPSTRNVLIRSLPAITRLRAAAARAEEGNRLDIEPHLHNALDAVRAYQTSGSKSFDDFMAQGTMLDPQKWRDDPLAIGIAYTMVRDNPTTFARKLRELAEASESAASGQMLMGELDPSAAIEDAIARNFYYGRVESDPVPGEGGIFDSAMEPDDYSGGATGAAMAAPNGKAWDADPIIEHVEGNPSGALVRFPNVLNPVAMPEMLKLAREIMGTKPLIKKLRGRKLGHFLSSEGGAAGPGRIELDPQAAKTPEQLARVLAHEIGHLVDWLPDLTLKRGNLLGRLNTLTGFLKHNLGGLNDKEIREELLALTHWWHPWTEGRNASYDKYRRSSRELYAEALSVWLVAPGELERRAPKFAKALYEKLDRKPDVLDAYLNVQDFLGGTAENIAAARRADIREGGFARAEEVIRARIQERRASELSLIHHVRQLLMDKGAPVVKLEKRLERRGITLSEAESARYALDELDYRDGVNHAFLTNVERDVTQPLLDAGVSMDDIGEYMLLRRIANERTNLANPWGHTPETANQQLNDLRRLLGTEKTAELERRIATFDDMVYDAAERAADVGVYNRQTFETVIKPNKGNYAAFAVVDHIDDFMPAGIRQQVGTWKEVGNPFIATVMKTISVNRAIELNHAKNVTRDMLLNHFPGDIAKKRVKPGGVPKRPEYGRDHLVVMENGRPAFYEVDEYVAKAFQGNEIGLLARIGRAVSSATYRVFHPLYVTLSPSWQVFNLPRDLKRTYKNLAVAGEAGAKSPSVGQVLRGYLEAAGPAWKRAKREYDPIIHEMMESKALDVPFHAFDAMNESASYDRLLRRYGMGTKEEARNVLTRWVGALFNGVERVGIWTETLPKVVAWQAMGRAGVGGKLRAYHVRNSFGTPNYKRKGLATELTNGLFMYSNVIIQGLHADLRIGTRPKSAGGYWFRSLLMDFGPKMAMRAAKVGLFGAGVKAVFDLIPDYDLANYIVIPVGVREDERTGEMKAVYLRLPHDDTNRVFAGAAWLLSQGEGAEGLAFTVGQSPFGSWSPPLEIASAWKDYAQGVNPIDDFRKRQIVSRSAWTAGGWHSAQEMIRWTTDQFGIATVIVDGLAGLAAAAGEAAGVDTEPVTGLFSEPGREEIPHWVERVVGGVPGLERILRISDRGLSEDDWDSVKLEDEERARFRLSLPAQTRTLVRARNRYNRLGEERLNKVERVRRLMLNDFYARAYLPLTRQIREAEAMGDTARSAALRDALENATKTTADQMRNAGGNDARNPDE